MQYRHRYHHDHCTSCEDISEDGDILATCLHLYDVDVKDGACYMLKLPQPRLPTPTIFDGTSPIFPEWARELRAYLNISQFKYINLFHFAYDAEEPLTTDITVLRTEAGARHKVLKLYVSGHIFKNLEKSVRYLQQTVETSESSMGRYNKIPTTSMHNKYFRMRQLQQDVEQENSSATSSRMLTNWVASGTTYFDDFNGQTSDGKCFDNSVINMLQELGCSSTPYSRALYILNLDGQRRHNDNSFRNGCRTSQHTR